MKSMVIWMINKIFNFYKSSKTCDLGRWTDIKAAVQVSQAFVNHHCYSASKLSVLIIRCVQESSQGGGHLDNWWENWEPPSCAHWQRGQWVRKIWIWPNISLHWCALLCSQGWDIFSWAGWTEGETMLSSQHHPAGRISQGPRVSGPEAILTQLPILIRASDGNKQARGISQGPGGPRSPFWFWSAQKRSGLVWNEMSLTIIIVIIELNPIFHNPQFPSLSLVETLKHLYLVRFVGEPE